MVVALHQQAVSIASSICTGSYQVVSAGCWLAGLSCTCTAPPNTNTNMLLLTKVPAVCCWMHASDERMHLSIRGNSFPSPSDTCAVPVCHCCRYLVCADVVSSPNSVIQNSTCFWIRNISSQADRKCPSKMAQMCTFDYTSPAQFVRTFEGADLGDDTSGTSMGVLIGAIVGGVVGGLLLIGGLLFCCIKKQKAHQKKIAEQMDAKLAQRKSSNNSGVHGAVPITASAAGNSHV